MAGETNRNAHDTVYSGWSVLNDENFSLPGETEVAFPENFVFEEMYTENIGEAEKKPFYSFVKRVFDIFASFIALAIGFIPMVILAFLIKFDDPYGPCLYRQGRIGLNGRKFIIYKFRSMYVDAEKSGAKWASKEDDRVTRIGKFLRKTRLDELPQFYNILKGDMSFVGPRPERLLFYRQFEQYIHGFSQRAGVMPGLTGLAQISGGYELPPSGKIVYDLDYIKKRSFSLDLKIIFKTIAIVFTHDGAR